MDTPEGPSLDARIRVALSGAIRKSGKSRETIAQELSDACGLNVSVFTLNNWTCDSKRERRIPAEAIPALCEVLGDDSLQRLMMSDEHLNALELGDAFSKWLGRNFKGRRMLQGTKRR